MPKVIDNEDGTKTFTINSSELRALKNFVEGQIPEAKKILQAVEGKGLRDTLEFVRAVIR